MKTYQKVRDVFASARLFHQQLSQYYEKLTAASDRERIRLLLDHLGRHERYLEKALKRYEEEASRKTLETWFQYVPEQKDRKTGPAPIIVHQQMTVEAVARTAINLNEYLIQFYRSLAEQSDFPRVREAFDEILKMEEKNQRQISQALLGIEEL